MKITHLIYSFNFGGSETMLVDIVNHQVEKACVNLIIINKFYNKTLVNKIDKRVKVYFINRVESSKNPCPIIRLNVLLLKLHSNVVHCHNHNIIPLLLPSLKKKAVLTVHDVGVNTKHFNQFNQLFAISKVVKEDIKNRSGFKATLVYNGICVNKVMHKVEVTKINILKIVIVSRLRHEKKGQHLAIEALHTLKEKGITNIQLDMIGSGESEDYLKELTSKYGLTGQVNFLGLKDHDYIYAHLKDYDLLVQPSLFEGFGLTVAEAMAARIPVLVSDIDGPMEIIENGQYGFCFEAGNADKLAGQIEQIISEYDTERIQARVNAAYKRVKENFEIESTAADYIINY